MLRTLLSKSLHTASFLWPFLLSHQIGTNLKIWKLWILWPSNWNIWAYYSRISRDEKTKLQNQDPKIWSFRWFFELFEFELKGFPCRGLLVNSEGTEEFVRFSRSFQLQEFELHEFNCSFQLVACRFSFVQA